MTEYLAERTLASMRFRLSITRPGINAMNEKMALEMAISALEKQRKERHGNIKRNHRNQ